MSMRSQAGSGRQRAATDWFIFILMGYPDNSTWCMAPARSRSRSSMAALRADLVGDDPDTDWR